MYHALSPELSVLTKSCILTKFCRDGECLTDFHSLPTPFPAKADAVVTKLVELISNPDPKIVDDFQELCGALLYVQIHTVPAAVFIRVRATNLTYTRRHPMD